MPRLHCAWVHVGIRVTVADRRVDWRRVGILWVYMVSLLLYMVTVSNVLLLLLL